MESANFNYSQKRFLKNVKAVQIMQAFQKVDTSREHLVCGLFAEGVAIQDCFQNINRRVKERNLVRRFDDELSAARVNSESLLLICNESDASDYLILEPPKPSLVSYVNRVNRLNDELRENLNLTQHQFNITMAVDVDSAKLWIVSEDVVAGPLNFGHISESSFSEKELIKKAESLHPGFSAQWLKSIVLGFHESYEWIVSLLEESKLCQVKSILIPGVEEDTFERIVTNFKEYFLKTKIALECEELKRYFDEVDAQKGNTTRGRRSTGQAINKKQARTLLVIEKATFIVFVVQIDNKDRIFLREKNDENLPGMYHVKEKMPFLTWLKKNHLQIKGDIVLVSPHTVLGRRLERECQGIGAILDARRDLPSDED